MKQLTQDWPGRDHEPKAHRDPYGAVMSEKKWHELSKLLLRIDRSSLGDPAASRFFYSTH